ncbi:MULTISPECIES: hypothetical protein [Enterobacteriaceae]|uniref:hypothetical protein n=1 Tax=Enterobacteriaceae TaxID=543 RepID=UPI00123C3B23|nr:MULTISPECIES: hypothetical protein [Enterobacteriaceae]MBX8659118.1 hypothetical protein [Citrobacter freundii]
MDFSWKQEYSQLASQFLKKHFGSAQGVTHTFPCMREDYPWNRPLGNVADSRVPAKNNTEYHGLESYAMQYHATAQYEDAYQLWILAGMWRREDMRANGFDDSGHIVAIEFCVKQALYNQALNLWQKNTNGSSVPLPEMFGLDSIKVKAKESKALTIIDDHINNKR